MADLTGTLAILFSNFGNLSLIIDNLGLNKPNKSETITLDMLISEKMHFRSPFSSALLPQNTPRIFRKIRYLYPLESKSLAIPGFVFTCVDMYLFFWWFFENSSVI